MWFIFWVSTKITGNDECIRTPSVVEADGVPIPQQPLCLELRESEKLSFLGWEVWTWMEFWPQRKDLLLLDTIKNSIDAKNLSWNSVRVIFFNKKSGGVKRLKFYTKRSTMHLCIQELDHPQCNSYGSRSDAMWHYQWCVSSSGSESQIVTTCDMCAVGMCEVRTWSGWQRHPIGPSSVLPHHWVWSFVFLWGSFCAGKLWKTLRCDS